MKNIIKKQILCYIFYDYTFLMNIIVLLKSNRPAVFTKCSNMNNQYSSSVKIQLILKLL